MAITTGYSGDGGAATNAGLNYPSGVAVDAAGNLYIADSDNKRIRKVDTNGIITTVAGNGSAGYSGDGGAATNARLYYPTGVAVDASGNLYIADTENNRIRKVDTNGIITTVAGKGGRRLFRATAVWPPMPACTVPPAWPWMPVGNLYIADTTTTASARCCSMPNIPPSRSATWRPPMPAITPWSSPVPTAA